MWTDESWAGEAETEFVFETGRGRRAPQPPAPFRGAPFRGAPRPRPRPRPRGRRAGSALWDEPPLAAPCPSAWSGDPDDPESLRSLQAALNRIFDELIRRASAGRRR